MFVYLVEWHNEGAQLIEYTNDNFAVLSDLVSGTSYPVTIICIAGDNQTEGEPYKFVKVTSKAHAFCQHDKIVSILLKKVNSLFSVT